MLLLYIYINITLKIRKIIIYKKLKLKNKLFNKENKEFKKEIIKN